MRPYRIFSLLAVVMLTAVALALTFGALMADDSNINVVTVGNLSASKTVDQATALVGSTLNYTVVISNVGDNADTVMTDTLPTGLAVVPESLNSITNNAIATTFTVTGDTVLWEGLIGNGGNVEIQFGAVVTTPLAGGDVVTNTAYVTGTGALLAPKAETAILSQTPAALTAVKTADRETLYAGTPVQYTVVVSNSGETTADPVTINDPLPSELNYVTDSLSVVGGGAYSVTADVINWTGVITGQTAVTLTYAAELAVTDPGASGVFTNTATVTGVGDPIEASSPLNYQSNVFVYFPIISKPLPSPILLSISTPTSNNDFQSFSSTVTWSDIGNATYVLEEARNPDFTNAVSYDAGSSTSQVVTHDSSTNMKYYYRVRAFRGQISSGWSNILMQYAPYADSFTSGIAPWAIRREDTDDVDNLLYHDPAGYMVTKIKGRWDYAIAAPMVSVPWQSYSLRARVRLSDGIDNLQSYGLVFGGDWNGAACPNSVFTSCFNHYYRLNVIWFGTKPTTNRMRVQIKRIDYHDPINNSGRGDLEVIGFTDIDVGDPSGWNDWTINVYPNGLIQLYVNTNFAAQGVDPDMRYVGSGTYFGTFASSNEYSGTAAQFDWVRVGPLQ
ncbi:MAG: DUF11 domain-containing protein [Ardenticatenaceae bacterium]|nr:DUF11 domain-containing protein [Ardenticatenaceae bacterium]